MAAYYAYSLYYKSLINKINIYGYRVCRDNFFYRAVATSHATYTPRVGGTYVDPIAVETNQQATNSFVILATLMIASLQIIVK